MKKCEVGIIGIGKISGIYLDNLTGMFSDRVNLRGVTDLMTERAAVAAQQYNTVLYDSVDAMLGDPRLDLVLNLTTPQSHYELCKKVLEAGKHVYVEKPLSLTTKEASALVDLAKKKNLYLGGAPDTFLGSGIQTCRKLIDDGWIGKPIGANAFMMNHGHESWHPDPEFYYKDGAGPLFDMGPYYLTALINLLGPIKAVSGSATKSFETRTITSEEKYGTIIDVDVPTHIAALVTFESGAVASLTTSFDVWKHSMPNIEIYGTEGSLQVPNPNTFGGPIFFCKAGQKEWQELPLLFDYSENSRGFGVADIAESLAEGRVARANGELARHVVEVMEAILASSEKKAQVEITHSCERPEAR